jgi:hypothetical protein
VGRIAEKYDISPGVGDESLDDQLAKRWLGADEYPETSLRQLVDWLHKHLLRTQYTEHGRSTLEPHLESDYQALQDEDSQNHHAVLSDLETDGIDGEALISDFVSPSTMYRHLTGCLGAEKDNDAEGTASSDRKKLEYVENTAEMYVSDLLSAWENRGDVPRATEAGVTFRIYLECPVCAKQTNIRTVQQRGYICKEHMSAPPDRDAPEERRQTEDRRGDR